MVLVAGVSVLEAEEEINPTGTDDHPYVLAPEAEILTLDPGHIVVSFDILNTKGALTLTSKESVFAQLLLSLMVTE